MKSEAQASGMECLTNAHLGFGISPTNERHLRAPGGGDLHNRLTQAEVER